MGTEAHAHGRQPRPSDCKCSGATDRAYPAPHAHPRQHERAPRGGPIVGECLLCDSCRHAARCAALRLACERLAAYSFGAGRLTWQQARCYPTRAAYQVLFKPGPMLARHKLNEFARAQIGDRSANVLRGVKRDVWFVRARVAQLAPARAIGDPVATPRSAGISRPVPSGQPPTERIHRGRIRTSDTLHVPPSGRHARLGP